MAMADISQGRRAKHDLNAFATVQNILIQRYPACPGEQFGWPPVLRRSGCNRWNIRTGCPQTADRVIRRLSLAPRFRIPLPLRLLPTPCKIADYRRGGRSRTSFSKIPKSCQCSTGWCHVHREISDVTVKRLFCTLHSKSGAQSIEPPG